MKSIINLFVFLLVTFALNNSSYANNGKDVSSLKSKTPSIRITEVRTSNFQNDYEDAISNDPWKSFNKSIFAFNNTLDDYFLEPLARGYRAITPKWGRERVSNAFSNIKEPSNFVNSILQGDIESAFRSFWRFTINSTFGVGGINDVASGFGLQQKEKYFSQTMALYGVSSGPYLVVPFMGPSTARDFFGNLVDNSTVPSTYFEEPAVYIASGSDLIQTRESILDVTDDMKKNSFDLYSSQKSGYLQYRKKKVLDTIE
jgi:phospholipid-binding lipoprotein MlaA